MNSRLTIKDIAKALNVHHSTVSRALRGDDRVKEATRKVVQEYADEHGYQINMVGRELRGEKRNVVAVLVPNISHRFFSNVVSYFANFASENDLVVSVFQSNECYNNEVKIIDTIIQNNFAGVIASLSMESKNAVHFQKLKKHNVPLVMFDRVSSDINVPKVTINNAEIMHDVVNRLVNKGRKRIVHISGPTYLNVFGDRQRGYDLAINYLGLEYRNTILVEKAFAVEDGVRIAKNLFTNEIVPDAIISDSSNLVFGLIKALKKNRLANLHDIDIVAFGENPIFEIMDSPLTSIIQPDEEIAQKTFEMLLNKIENTDADSTQTIVLPAQIIE